MNFDALSAVSLKRRRLLAATGGLVAFALAARRPHTAIANAKFSDYPFSLGVASGDPDDTSVVLWTRLAPRPLDFDGGMPPADARARWQVAADPQFRQVVARGEARASASLAHSVHVLVEGLEPDREYWYQFAAGREVSPVGRTRTLPAAEATPEQLDFAFVSCQNYEHGYFTPLARLAEDDVRFVIHLGDYIYEYARSSRPQPRYHPEFAATDLDTFRHRHAFYKRDRDLQAVHAAHPFVCTWDDHEVENDYAGSVAANFDDARTFLERRAAAYQAYFEHLPLRVVPQAARDFANLRIYRRFSFGRLASFHVLDTRQYRADQVCGPDPKKGGGQMVDAACARLGDPTRSMLGALQEDWLFSGLAAAETQWHAIAQQYLVGPLRRPNPKEAGDLVWSDGWDGYPASRQRLLGFLANQKIRNPIFIGGDIHSFWAGDLKLDFQSETSPIVASEFVTTSVSADSLPYETLARVVPQNPHIQFFETRLRGYTRCRVDRQAWRTDLKTVATVKEPDDGSPLTTLATFAVNSDVKGVERG